MSGHWIGTGSGAANQILLNQSYASQHADGVGAQLPINGSTYTVVGLVKPTLTGTIADVYFPLSTIQNLAGKSGRITQILVKVKDASQVDAVAKRIQAELPGATVITTQSLANQVTGSLKDVKKLADSLGGALGVIVIALVGFWILRNHSSSQLETHGSENYQNQFKNTGTFYQHPPIPGVPGGGR